MVIKLEFTPLPDSNILPFFKELKKMGESSTWVCASFFRTCLVREKLVWDILTKPGIIVWTRDIICKDFTSLFASALKSVGLLDR